MGLTRENSAPNTCRCKCGWGQRVRWELRCREPCSEEAEPGSQGAAHENNAIAPLLRQQQQQLMTTMMMATAAADGDDATAAAGAAVHTGDGVSRLLCVSAMLLIPHRNCHRIGHMPHARESAACPSPPPLSPAHTAANSAPLMHACLDGWMVMHAWMHACSSSHVL